MTKSKIPLKAGKLLVLVILLLVSVPALAQVDTAWVRRYNGPGNSSGEVYDLETDFSINVIPDTLWVSQGYSGNYKVILTSINGFASNCTLTVVGYPAGATATFTPPKLVPTDSSTLTLFIPDTTSLDTLTLTITATEMVKGKRIAHSKDVTLIVILPTWMFDIEVFPDTQIISQGGSTTYDVTIIPNLGFTAPCTLFVQFVGGLPSGVTADFDSNPIPPNDTSTLTITTLLSTPPDTYDLAIIAVATKKQKDTTYVKLIIEQVATGIRGNVKDASQQNLQDVLVEALQESLIIGSDYSGTNGNYSIPSLPAGFYNVRAQKPGYETKTYNGVQVTAGQTTTQDFNLNSSPEDTIFYDDFSGKALDWQFEGPCTWIEENDVLWTSATGHRVFCLATAGDLTWTDYIYEVDVYGMAGVDKCIEFRVQDYSNHYYINLRSDWPNQDNDSLYFCKIVDGTCVYYESVDWSSVNQFSYHLKVEIFGNHFKVSVGDNFVHEFVDEENTFPQGKIGLGCWTGDANTCNICFEKVLVAHQYKPFYFVHITDPHVGCGPVHPHAIERWEEAINTITNWPDPPDFVLCTGDIVDFAYGPEADFNWAAISLTLHKRDDTFYLDADYRIPIYFSPGNHDAARYDPAYGDYWRPLDFNAFHENIGPDYYVIHHKNCVIFSMNSGKDANWPNPVNPRGDGLNDQYGNEVTQLPLDLDALDGQNNGVDYSNYYKIITMHHPYNNPDIPSELFFSGTFSYGRESFINACVDYGVHLVLCGHIHDGWKWRRRNKDGQSWQSGGGTIFEITNSLDGPDSYRKLWVPIRLPKGEELVDSVMYFRSTMCFAIDCEAVVHVYDQHGNHDGPNQNGEIEINIPGSTYHKAINDTLAPNPVYTEFSVYKEDTTNYTFVIDGLTADTMNVLASTYIKDGVWSEAQYDSVPIYSGSVATMNANGSILDYTMTILDPDSTKREVIPTNWQGNLPPVEPTTPSGPTMVVSTDSSAYGTSSTDPENDQVFYMFDWDDSTYSNWQGPFNSGDTCLAYHRWMEAGAYNVRVRAIDAWDHMSAWSDSLSVIVRNRGDANGDAVINVTDVVYLINYLFLVPPGPAPIPPEAGDVNCDGVVNVTDVVYLINYLFLVPPGPPPGC